MKLKTQKKESVKNIEEGLSNAWYISPLPRKELKPFTRRSDWPGIKHFGGYFLLLISTGTLAYSFLGTWYLFWPAYLVFSLIFAFSEAAWHETVHGTAFKSRWLNKTVNFIASILGHRDIIYSTWSHAVHHSYTGIKDTDPELQAPRPPNLFIIILNFTRIQGSFVQLWMMLQHAFGKITPLAARVVPENSWKKLIWNARMFIGIYILLILWCFFAQSWLPIIFLFLPRFFGAWGLESVVTMQHPGLAEGVWDHRLNTRSVKVARWVQFLYFNMNYHIEHHMYPMVPFHSLESLNEKVKDYYPKTYQGYWSVYRDLIPTLFKQVKDAKIYIHQKLPPENGWRGNEPLDPWVGHDKPSQNNE